MPTPARALILAVLASAVVSAGASTGADDRAEVVIRGVNVVDLRQGVVLPARDIVIRGTRIASVHPAGGTLPPAKTLIDGRGKFALPGLIDAHVQLARFTRDTAASLLSDGVTAVRDLGTDPARIAEWRRALARGQMYAPRIARACGALPAAVGAPVSDPRLRAPEPGCGRVGASEVSALAALEREATRLPADARGGAALFARYPGLHDQLERLVGAGFTPLAALRAVTIETAQAQGLPDLGEVAVGMAADVLITTGDPLADIRNARAIDAVVFRGEALTRAHLNLLRTGSSGRARTTPSR